jgi:hypothetical protein
MVEGNRNITVNIVISPLLLAITLLLQRMCRRNRNTRNEQLHYK